MSHKEIAIDHNTEIVQIAEPIPFHICDYTSS